MEKKTNPKYQKTGKSALVTSVLSLVLCFAMLIGTTLAWFTDSVTSAGNIIKSGTLDVTMEWADGKTDPTNTTWTDASTGAIFSNDLWEPGYVEVRHIKISNEGSLALKYQLNIVANEEVSILADVIDVYYMDPAEQIINRTSLEEKTPSGNLTTVLGEFTSTANGTLGKGESVTVTIALKMREEAGNEYQDLSIGSDFTINLYATQLESEADSFGTDYDKNAWLNEADTDWYDAGKTVYCVSTAAELAGLAQLVNNGTSFAGTTVYITKDIDLNNYPWTPIGTKGHAFGGTLDGKGNTIYNLNVTGTEGVGLIGFAGNAASIYDVNIENATVTGTHWVGAVLGYGYLSANSLKGCTVTNATIVCNPVKNIKGEYDDGDKAGAVAGMAINGNIYDNKAVNCTVTAYRDLGGIVGCAQAEDRDIAVENNTVDTVSLTYVNVDNYADNKTNQNARDVVGRTTGNNTVTIDKNTIKNVSVSASNGAGLADVLASGGDVVLANDITVSGTVITTNGVTEAYGNKVGVAQYGGTLDGNGNTLTETGTSAYVIVTHGGTIKNLSIVGGGRGIVIYAPTEDVIIDNVVIDGPGYAINTAEHNGQKLIVTNSTIKGWTSLAGLDSISFTNCLFGENSTKCWQNYGYSQNYDRLIKPYGQATFTDCTFEKGFYIDLSALASGKMITLANCNSDEVVLTADNYADHITIKLPSWATDLSECVNFN